MDSFEVKFIKDDLVDDLLNAKLIEILSICFPDQEIFKNQRYYKEKPQYRWYLETENKITAHLALHHKQISTKEGNISIGGIAEVCVIPEYRGQGLTKKLLNESEIFSTQNNFEFAVLFGESKIYGSSGYRAINNLIKYIDHKTNKEIEEINKDILIKNLSKRKWPDGLINLNGPTF